MSRDDHLFQCSDHCAPITSSVRCGRDPARRYGDHLGAPSDPSASIASMAYRLYRPSGHVDHPFGSRGMCRSERVRVPCAVPITSMGFLWFADFKDATAGDGEFVLIPSVVFPFGRAGPRTEVRVLITLWVWFPIVECRVVKSGRRHLVSITSSVAF